MLSLFQDKLAVLAKGTKHCRKKVGYCFFLSTNHRIFWSRNTQLMGTLKRMDHFCRRNIFSYVHKEPNVVDLLLQSIQVYKFFYFSTVGFSDVGTKSGKKLKPGLADCHFYKLT